MKITTNRHVARFREMETTWQWIVGAVVFLFLFLIWAQLLEPTSTAWAETADRMEANVERTSASISLGAKSRNAAMTYGPIELPDRKAVGSLELIEIVQGIIAEDRDDQQVTADVRQPLLDALHRGLG